MPWPSGACCSVCWWRCCSVASGAWLLLLMGTTNTTASNAQPQVSSTVKHRLYAGMTAAPVGASPISRPCRHTASQLGHTACLWSCHAGLPADWASQCLSPGCTPAHLACHWYTAASSSLQMFKICRAGSMTSGSWPILSTGSGGKCIRLCLLLQAEDGSLLQALHPDKTCEPS